MTHPIEMTTEEKSTLSNSILYWLLALTLVRGLIYASVVPPWQAPDEPAQFERVRASLTEAEWNSTSKNEPTWYGQISQSLFTFDFWDFLDSDRPSYSPEAPLGNYIALYQEIYGGLYGSRAAYALIGWPLFLARDQDIILQLYLVRVNTMLMNVGIIWLAYLIVRAVFPSDTFLTVGVPLLILFNPQHTHMLSTVNNGNLAELLTTTTLYFMVQGSMGGFTWRNAAAILGFGLAAMWTKATAYFLPFAIGCVGLFYLGRYRRHWPWLLLVSLILVSLGFFFVPQRLRLLFSDALALLNSNTIYLDPIVPQDLFRSFWAMPGWTIFQVHPFWYQIIGLACILAILGWIILLVTRWQLFFSAAAQPRLQALVIMAVAAVAALSLILGWNALTNSIVYRQGRSLYAVIVPISLFLMLGWRQLIPNSWRLVGLLTATILFFLFDSLVLFGYIIPIFYSRY